MPAAGNGAVGSDVPPTVTSESPLSKKSIVINFSAVWNRAFYLGEIPRIFVVPLLQIQAEVCQIGRHPFLVKLQLPEKASSSGDLKCCYSNMLLLTLIFRYSFQ